MVGYTETSAIIYIHIVIYKQPEYSPFKLFLYNKLIDYLFFDFFEAEIEMKLNYIAINALYNSFLCFEYFT